MLQFGNDFLGSSLLNAPASSLRRPYRLTSLVVSDSSRPR